jgi:hypothetical protein
MTGPAARCQHCALRGGRRPAQEAAVSTPARETCRSAADTGDGLTFACTKIHIERMIPTVIGFDWDRGNREKCQKHGVPTAVIESLFHSPLGVFPDPAHSDREERFKADRGRARCADRLYPAGASCRDTDPADQRSLHASEGGFWYISSTHRDALIRPQFEGEADTLRTSSIGRN